MENMLEVKGKIYQVEKGQLNLLLVDDNLFKFVGKISDNKIPTGKEAAKIQHPIKINKSFVHPIRGKIIGRRNRISFYDNIYNDIKTAMETGASKEELTAIIKKYYPNFTGKSPTSLAGQYVILVNNPNELKKNFSYKKKSKNKKRKKYGPRKPSDAYAYSKTYGIWILHEDVEKVKKVLRKVAYNYKPTIPILLKETGLKYSRLTATMNMLKQQNIVEKVSNPGERIYYKLK